MPFLYLKINEKELMTMNTEFLANILRKHVANKWERKIVELRPTITSSTQHSMGSSFLFSTDKVEFHVLIEVMKNNNYHQEVHLKIEALDKKNRKQLRLIQKNYEYNSYNSNSRFYQIANEMKLMF